MSDIVERLRYTKMASQRLSAAAAAEIERLRSKLEDEYERGWSSGFEQGWDAARETEPF